MNEPASILLVSSDAQLTSALEAAMVEAGYRVTHAASASEVRALGDAPIAAVVASVADGSARTFASLRDGKPLGTAPLLVVLGSDGRAGLEAARALGAHDFVSHGSCSGEFITRLG